MDDFVITNLHEARNEWCARLVSILTGHIIDGIKSLFNESWKICVQNNEIEKYLMTFQNLLSRVPKWNSVIIEEERNRIIEKSGCNYLEELITCVHIIQLKVLTCIRVGNKQKKIDINIPKLDLFIHKVYIHVARKVYSNVYLFEKNVPPLTIQRNNKELESIVQECILIAIRDSIPTEQIIRAYLDETVEEEEEVIIETIQPDISANTVSPPLIVEPPKEEKPPEIVPSIKNLDDEKVVTRLKFNDYDYIMDTNNKESIVNVPKDIEKLEEKSLMKKLLDEEQEKTNKINILDDNLDIHLDILELDEKTDKAVKTAPVPVPAPKTDELKLDIIEL